MCIGRGFNYQTLELNDYSLSDFLNEKQSYS